MAEGLLRSVPSSDEAVQQPIPTKGPDKASPLSSTCPLVTDLNKKVKDAERLLFYAAETGIAIENNVRDAVLKAKFASADNWDEQTAANLLSALTTLAAKLKPVTADSLKECAEQKVDHYITGGEPDQPPLLKLSGFNGSATEQSAENFGSRHRFTMYKQFLLPYVLFLIPSLVQPTVARGADPVSAGGGKTECCINAAADIEQLHKSADRLYAHFKPKEAARGLQKILLVDEQNLEALVKLSRTHIDIGDMISEPSPDAQERKMKEYRIAEDYARKAIRANPNSTWGYFYVAGSLGSMAILSPVDKQIDIAVEIRDAVEKAIALDPQNGFAYHIYGVWHRKMAEVSEASRVFVSVRYGRSIPAGSVEKSIEYLEQAVALNPKVLVSRLELARSYVAAENWTLARNSLISVRELPNQFSDDAKHKQKAEQLLEEIKER